jgi:lipoyl(octanoyl) transferase
MIHYLYLGRVDYGEALRLQEELVALRQQNRIGNLLLLLEHPPVLTLGRNANRSNILASDEMLAARGITLHEINRGGDVTYHGPGQLIGYPIFDLRSLRNANGSRLGPVDFVRLMEEALIRLSGEFGVQTGRICGLTGVWCGVPSPELSSKGEQCAAPSKSPQPGGRERKIAAIGIHVARGVTSHGFAFNVTTDLRDFALINPCGITDRPVTSLEKELAMEVVREVAGPKSFPSLESIARCAALQFGLVFNEQVLAFASLDTLRAHVEAGPEKAPEFPAQDTPLQVPPEIERLRRSNHRPISA